MRFLPTTPPGRTDGWDAAAWRANFMYMSVGFTVNHALVTLPIGYATALLDPAAGAVGTGAVMLSSMLSSLFLGSPAVAELTSKGALVVAMSACTLYVVFFAASAVMPAGSPEQWAAHLLGALLGGCGFGVLWTAQGAFFTSTCERVSALEGMPLEAVTSQLSGNFAALLLGTEFVARLGASLLRGTFLNFKLAQPLVGHGAEFFLFALVAGLMAAGLARLVADPASLQCESTSLLGGSRALAAFSLWRYPALWLISFTNLTFGFCAGYMNGYVNGFLATPSPTFGRDSLGTLLAVTCLSAALASALFGYLSHRADKRLLICAGAACFAAIPGLVLALHPDRGNGYWGAWLVVLYLLQGVGRAVYESTNKAQFADFFPGPQSAGAFANCIMQSAFANFLAYVLQSTLSERDQVALAWLVIALAALTAPGTYAAGRVRKDDPLWFVPDSQS